MIFFGLNSFNLSAFVHPISKCKFVTSKTVWNRVKSVLSTRPNRKNCLFDFRFDLSAGWKTQKKQNKWRKGKFDESNSKQKFWQFTLNTHPCGRDDQILFYENRKKCEFPKQTLALLLLLLLLLNEKSSWYVCFSMDVLHSIDIETNRIVDGWINHKRMWNQNENE